MNELTATSRRPRYISTGRPTGPWGSWISGGDFTWSIFKVLRENSFFRHNHYLNTVFEFFEAYASEVKILVGFIFTLNILKGQFLFISSAVLVQTKIHDVVIGLIRNYQLGLFITQTVFNNINFTCGIRTQI